MTNWKPMDRKQKKESFQARYLSEVISVTEGGEKFALVVISDNESPATYNVHLSSYVALSTYVVTRTVDGQAQAESKSRQ